MEEKVKNTAKQLKVYGVNVGQGKFHEEIVYATAVIYARLFNDMQEHLAKYQLSPSKLNALMIIKHQGGEGGISQRQIGESLLVSASNMTRFIFRLKRDGLIERAGHKTDKRITLIRITPKGSKILDKVWPSYQQKIKESVSGLSLSEQQTLSGLLQKWLGNLVEQNKEVSS